MSNAWGTFATIGSPNVPDWAPYSVAADNYRVWSTPLSGTIYGLRKPFCDMFDAIGYDLGKW